MLLHERFTGLHAGNAGSIGIIEQHLGHAKEIAIEGQDVFE